MLIRQKWFELGADALLRLKPERSVMPTVYGCPLCGRGFAYSALETGDLTVEDVPPASMGGRPLVLTCRECNSTAGHSLDSHALARDREIDFFEGSLDQPLRARYRAGQVNLNVDVCARGTSIHIADQPLLNHPDMTELAKRTFGQQVADGFNLSFVGAAHDPRQALRSLLRTAYLAAFAVFGYSYTFQPTLRAIVRQELLEPSGDHLRVFSMTRPNERDAAPFLMVVERPIEFVSLLVSVGRYSVFLPWPPKNPGLYEYLADRDLNQLHKVTMTGTRVEWPDGPLHAFDRPRASASGPVGELR